jgi:hypothetical protein
MKKMLYILFTVSLFSGQLFAIMPIPVDYSSYYNNLDGYPELGQISAPIPNPVVDYAEIWYNIPENKTAEIAIYNFAGVKVKSVNVGGGLGKVDIEAYDLVNGVYFVCLIYEGKNIDSKKLVKK